MLCANRVVGPTKYTYVSGAHNSASFIDHFFINEALSDKVELSQVIDSGINLSDHLPLVLHLSDCLPVKNSDCDIWLKNYNNKQKRLRWDKADLISYYHATNVYLSDISYLNIMHKLCSGLHL